MLQRLGRTRAIMGVLAVGIALGVSATTLAIGPDTRAFRPAGDTRYAFKGVTVGSTTTTASSSFVAMSGVSNSVTIPTGHKADLFITFSSELNGCSGIYVRADIDGGTIASPGAALLFSHTGGSAEAHGFTWMKTVGDGAHTIQIEWLSIGGCDHAFAGVRSLFITANII